ncbi:MAG: anti-sigma factor [Cyanobacteria bacterium P01_A01_bin.114]
MNRSDRPDSDRPDSGLPDSGLPDRWQDLLAGHALGDLSRDEQAELDRLLAEQPTLKAELLAYEKTLDTLPTALTLQPPPPHLEPALLNAVTQPQANAPRSMSWVRWGWGAIAALALLTLGFDNWRLRQTLANRQKALAAAQTTIQQLQQDLEQASTVLATLQQPTRQVYTLAGTGRLVDTTGSLIVVPGHSEVALVANNLPTLPEEQIYRLWAIADKQTAPVFCGQFKANQTGSLQWSVPDDICVASPAQVLITIDPLDAPAVPGGELVLQSTSS